METYKSNTSEKNALEHLKQGVSPIMACIGTRKDFMEHPGLTEHLGYWGENQKRLLVDYGAYPHENDARGIKNFGTKTYAISEVNDLDKFSLEYVNCTGMIAAGQDKLTGKNISFFTHQDTIKMMPEGKMRDQFLADIKSRLKELNNRSVPGTVDAVIFGGSYVNYDKLREEQKPRERVDFEKAYKDSVDLLSRQISDTLGFEPSVIAGPKTDITHFADDAIYDNEHRRLYLRRPEIGETSSESFSPHEMGEREEKWRKEWK